jgi:hypothetical protein
MYGYSMDSVWFMYENYMKRVWGMYERGFDYNAISR